MKFISNKLLFALFSIGVFGSGALNGSDMKRSYYGTEHTVTIAELEELGHTMVKNALQYGRDPSSNLLTLTKNMPYIFMQKATDLDGLLAKIDAMDWMEWPTHLDTPKFRESLQQAVIAAKNAIATQLENLANNEAASHATRQAAANQAAQIREQAAQAEEQQEKSRQLAHAQAEKLATQQLLAQAERLTAELNRFRNTAEMNITHGLRNPSFYWDANDLIVSLNSTIIEVRAGRESSETLRDALNYSTGAFEQLKQRFTRAQQQQARKRWKNVGDRVRADKRAEQARLEAQRLARESQRREEQLRLEEEARRDARRTELSEQGEQTIAAREAMRKANIRNRVSGFLGKARSKIATRKEAARLEQLRIERLEAQRREEQLRLEEEAQRREEARRAREAEEAREQAAQEFAAKLGGNRAGVADEADRIRAEKIAQLSAANKNVVQPALRQTSGPVKKQDEKKSAGRSKTRDVSGAEGMWGGKGAHKTNTSGRASELKTATNSAQQNLVNDIIAQLVTIEKLPRNMSKFSQMNSLGTQINVTKLNNIGWELLETEMQSQGVGISLLENAYRDDRISAQALRTIVQKLNIR